METRRNINERIDHVFASIELLHPDQFTERELEILQSIEGQYRRKRFISAAQGDLVEEISRRASER